MAAIYIYTFASFHGSYCSNDRSVGHYDVQNHVCPDVSEERAASSHRELN
jgi:hypothetical protein